CSPENDSSCLGYQWSYNDAAAAGAQYPEAANCGAAAAPNFTWFAWNLREADSTGGFGAAAAAEGDIPAGANVVSNTAFTLGAGGYVLRDTRADQWTIDQNKQMLNTQSGI